MRTGFDEPEFALHYQMAGRSLSNMLVPERDMPIGRLS